MRSSLFLTGLLAVAVSASPALKIVEEIVTKTVTLQPGQHAPTAAPVAKPAPVAAAPKPASNGGGFLQHSNPSSSSPAPSGNQYVDVANKYRALYNLPLLSWDQSMIPNCDQTGGDGIHENHIMIQGIGMGQVITPGIVEPNGHDMQGLSPFEIAYCAWMCESHDAILGNKCDIVQSVTPMTYGGDRGHYDILVNPAYTKIACSFTPQNGQLNPSSQFQGLYVCDLAQ